MYKNDRFKVLVVNENSKKGRNSEHRSHEVVEKKNLFEPVRIKPDYEYICRKENHRPKRYVTGKKYTGKVENKIHRKFGALTHKTSSMVFCGRLIRSFSLS